MGRYLCTFEEIEARYVLPGDVARNEIWSAFRTVLALLKECAGSVAEVWIGGSFITSECSPQDIDVVFWITEESYRETNRTQEGRFVVGVLGHCLDSLSRLHPLVDGYLLVMPPTEYDQSNQYNYSSNRGYWDQFWSKARFNDLDDPRWNYPSAGYLEVIVDGFIK